MHGCVRGVFVAVTVASPHNRNVLDRVKGWKLWKLTMFGIQRLHGHSLESS